MSTKTEKPKRIEGYWYKPFDDSCAAYPFPRARKNAWEDAAVFIIKLQRMQESAHVVAYKGISNCRLCKKMNGSTEFVVEGKDYIWKWPSGLLHYVQVHNVKPSRDFRKFVEDYDTRL